MGAGLIEDFIPAVQYVYTPAKTKTVKELFSEYLEFLGKQWEEHKRNYDPSNTLLVYKMVMIQLFS